MKKVASPDYSTHTQSHRETEFILENHRETFLTRGSLLSENLEYELYQKGPNNLENKPKSTYRPFGSLHFGGIEIYLMD